METTHLKTQLFLSVATPMPELFLPITNAQFVKPRGGLWTSTYDGLTSAWVEWCVAEQYGSFDTTRWFLLTPAPAMRVLTVDSVADMTALYEQYVDRSIGLPFLNAIDFEAMARDYDAMHVTERGQHATHLSLPRNLYGWDCESTCWFRWCFTTIEEIKNGVSSARVAA